MLYGIMKGDDVLVVPEGEGRAVAVQAGHHKAHFPSSLAMTKEKYPEGSVRSSKCS